LQFYFVHNYKQYQNLLESEKDKINLHLAYINEIIPNNEQIFYVQGYSNVSHRIVNFLCDFRHPMGFPNVNWRESVLCPATGFNNRMRFSIHLIESFLNLNSNSNIYLMEQVTPLYNHLIKLYPTLLGSEYLKNSTLLGSANTLGIRNEDATALTFQDNSFDAILSFDVFEHIPNVNLALSECFRVLKNGGKLLLSVPFNVNNEKNLTRSIINDNGEIIHLLEPEYHGDPIGNGILCFHHFGWEFLDDLKLAGFRDVCAILGWSIEYGYLTPQIQFMAVK